MLESGCCSQSQSTMCSKYEQDELSELMERAGIGNMTTLRDLQAGMLQALDEIRERNQEIEELRTTVAEKDFLITNLNKELTLLKTVLENPLSTAPSTNTGNFKKRIAISAAPVNINALAGSTSYAKSTSYV